MRRTIGERLQRSSREAVHVTASRDVDAESAIAAAERAEEASMTDVMLCALSETLGSHSEFNATFEDETHYIYEEHNIGVAVDIEEGLVTPVIEDVGSKTLREITNQRRNLTDRVVRGEYTMSTFRGGTFTVSNLGTLGVDSFTPVINPPEVSILGVGRTTQRAVPAEDDVAFTPVMRLDLSFDHRVVDGADAARFLETLSGNLSTAERYVGE